MGIWWVYIYINYNIYIYIIIIMRYNKVTSYLGQVGNKRNITTNGHSIRKEFWPSPLLFGGYSGTRRFPWCSPSLDGPNKAYSWMTSVNSEYIFRQVQLVPETCIPIIYPLYTWYIPIVYLMISPFMSLCLPHVFYLSPHIHLPHLSLGSGWQRLTKYPPHRSLQSLAVQHENGHGEWWKHREERFINGLV